MKQLRQYIRQILLTEAAKQPEDLTDGHTITFHDDGDGWIAFSLEWRPSPKGSPIETGKVVIAQNPARNGPCLNAWEVIGAEARHGFGPILYDVAMEYAGADGLMADRRSVSSDAMRIWNFYLNSRSDVKPKQLDVNRPTRFKGVITPNDESDDCQQDKYFNHHYAEGDNWENGKVWTGSEEDVEDYLASPMTKAFVKTGTGTTDKLKALGKFKEKKDSWR
jgi:hypothetical protein